jgi:hypothetical protein
MVKEDRKVAKLILGVYILGAVLLLRFLTATIYVNFFTALGFILTLTCVIGIFFCLFVLLTKSY